MSERVIGIMGAEPKEVEGIIALMESVQTTVIGQREYHKGQINGQDVVVVYSRCGKVAAATTVTTLILAFDISELIFTGVAGALDAALQIGDLVISDNLVQHDVDVRPFRPQFEIPILGITDFKTDKNLQQRAIKAAQDVIDSPAEAITTWGITEPKIVVGDIASGDQFISSQESKQAIKQHLPKVQCAEMEGAAVAQVCFEYDIPFVIIRTISDTADEGAGVDFPKFLDQVASRYSADIIHQIMKDYA